MKRHCEIFRLHFAIHDGVPSAEVCNNVGNLEVVLQGKAGRRGQKDKDVWQISVDGSIPQVPLKSLSLSSNESEGCDLFMDEHGVVWTPVDVKDLISHVLLISFSNKSLAAHRDQTHEYICMRSETVKASFIEDDFNEDEVFDKGLDHQSVIAAIKAAILSRLQALGVVIDPNTGRAMQRAKGLHIRLDVELDVDEETQIVIARLCNEIPPAYLIGRAESYAFYSLTEYKEKGLMSVCASVIDTRHKLFNKPLWPCIAYYKDFDEALLLDSVEVDKYPFERADLPSYAYDLIAWRIATNELTLTDLAEDFIKHPENKAARTASRMEAVLALYREACELDEHLGEWGLRPERLLDNLHSE